jgi:hypothetical protein
MLHASTHAHAHAHVPGHLNTGTHTDTQTYVIHVAFARQQQRFLERASVLSYTYIACLVLKVRNVFDKSCKESQNTFNVQNFFPSLWDNVEKYRRAKQATDEYIIRCMPFACWITKATHTHKHTHRHTHTQYVTLIALPRQQWLRERASHLPYRLRILPLLLLNAVGSLLRLNLIMLLLSRYKGYTAVISFSKAHSQEMRLLPAREISLDRTDFKMSILLHSSMLAGFKTQPGKICHFFLCAFFWLNRLRRSQKLQSTFLTQLFCPVFIFMRNKKERT